MSVIPSHLIATALKRMQLSSQPKTNEHWPTFEDILQRLHGQGIYIHPEQLAEFLLAHGLPVHLRYVPAHLRLKAIKVNESYQGDMVRVIEELEPPYWDLSWMKEIYSPPNPNNLNNQAYRIEELEQPSWDYH